MPTIMIIGNGPAGISASLYAVRAGVETIVVGKDGGALVKAEKIENYYGLREPVSGRTLQENGIAQARLLGVKLITEEVVGLNWDGRFLVKTDQHEYRADSVILTTGVSRKAPKIDGLKELEGRGVSYCAVCDAFFYRGKGVAVLGNSRYAAEEARELLSVVGGVTVLTNGLQPAAEFPASVRVKTDPIRSLLGEDKLAGILFEDGSKLEAEGVFVAYGTAGSTDLARKLGAVTEKSRIVVDEHMATNVPGLFAAGDCTGGMLQIAKAVYEGAVAGTEAARYIKNITAPQ